MSAGSQFEYSFLGILGLASSVPVLHFFPSSVPVTFLCALLLTQSKILQMLSVHPAQRWSLQNAQSFAPFSRWCDICWQRARRSVCNFHLIIRGDPSYSYLLPWYGGMPGGPPGGIPGEPAIPGGGNGIPAGGDPDGAPPGGKPGGMPCGT